MKVRICLLLISAFIVFSCDLSGGSTGSVLDDLDASLGYRPVTVEIREIETGNLVMKNTYSYGSDGYLERLECFSDDGVNSSVYGYEYNYDSQGRLVSIIRTNETDSSSLGFSYDEKGRLYALNGRNEYLYNDQGEMTEMISSYDKTTYLYRDGLLVEWRMYDDTNKDPVNSSRFVFNEKRQLYKDELYEKDFETAGNGAIESYTYSYDADGNIQQILYAADGEPDETRTFRYDRNNCLSEINCLYSKSGELTYKDFQYSFSYEKGDYKDGRFEFKGTMDDYLPENYQIYLKMIHRSRGNTEFFSAVHYKHNYFLF